MRLIVLTSLLLLGACEVRTADEADNRVAPPAPVAPVAPIAPVAPNDGQAPPPPIPGLPGAPKAQPAPIPPDPNAIPASEKTAAAAKQLLDDYFAALATKQYGRAYRMWGGKGEASGMSEAQFAASFAKYKIYDGRAFEAGESNGAAGSIYIDFPVTVTGILAKGGGFSLSGPMTLKRVNDVDGSTAEQRRWHISSSGLKPRP
jgi:hypothetical protein